MARSLVRTESLTKHYSVAGRAVRALDAVDFELPEGKTVAVVGESGSGKTTLGNLILGLEDPGAGRIWFGDRELRSHRPKSLCKAIQVVQQNPYSALNPRRPVRHAIELPLLVHGMGDRVARRRRVAELLERVELGPEYMDRYPSTLSGGQRQRVALARALAAEPRVIVLDEPTSALDVSVQAKIIALLQELQRSLRLTYMFITHDLGVVRNIADRVVVLYRGRIVEAGDTEAVFATPRHRYTVMLLSAIPVITEEDAAFRPHWPWEGAPLDDGGAASPGCRFAFRCPFATEACRLASPVMAGDARQAFACHNPAP